MILGITGGVGTGKSTVLKILRDRYFYHVFEADKIGHEVIKPATLVYKMIVEHFGNEILLEDGNIDRHKLANIVFADREELEYLNRLVHPEVISELKNRIVSISESEEDANFVIESAILFETELHILCDKVWYVRSDVDKRVERLRESRGYTEDKISKIIAQQLNDKEFSSRADATIDNSGSVEETEEQLRKLIEN